MHRLTILLLYALQNCYGFALIQNMDIGNMMRFLPFQPSNMMGFLPFQQPIPLDDIVVTEIATFQQLLFRDPRPNEDMFLTVNQITRKNGYNLEEHFVTTDDGYILRLFRLHNNGPPVLLMHGILLSSDDFFIAGPESALAYWLSNKGYDVWIGNFRGNKFSRNNTNISPDTESARFFNFTWNEMGRFDLPTTIDYILECTNRSQLSYVGFSQGNTAFFVMGSVLPEYNKKISIMIALSPIAFGPNILSPVVRFMAFNRIPELLTAVGIYEFLPFSPLVRAAFAVLCANENVALVACSSTVYTIFGFDRGELNVTNLPVIFSHAPAGCATKQVTHYLQLVRSGFFRNFDYGTAGNLAEYGTPEPPDYPLRKVTAPVALFFSNKDYFANITDVMRLQSLLPNVVDSYFVENFDHVDFLWGRNIRERINNRILSLIGSFS